MEVQYTHSHYVSHTSFGENEAGTEPVTGQAGTLCPIGTRRPVGRAEGGKGRLCGKKYKSVFAPGGIT